MPTGYTAELDDNPELTTAKWVTQNLARAFGVCVHLRDGPYGLTEDEIESHLEDEIERSTRYHREKTDEALKTLKTINDTPEAWNDLYTSAVDRLQEYNKRSREEAETTKLRHQQVEFFP